MLKEKNMNYIAMCPLIGGMALGNSAALNGKKPLMMLSYKEYEQNDIQIRNYWPEVPYYLIDSDTNTLNNESAFDIIRNNNIDIVSAVPFCSGLSMLNVSGQFGRRGAVRGEDNELNNWLLKISEFAINNLRPRAIIGENAPLLYGSKAASIAEKIYNIAASQNYSTTLIKTSALLHGNPQKRSRTFFVLYRDGNHYNINFSPEREIYFNDYYAHYEPEINDPNDPHNKPIMDIEKNPYWAYYKENIGANPRAIIEFVYNNRNDISLFEYYRDNNLLNDLLYWAEKSNVVRQFCKNFTKRLSRRIEKISRETQNGIWDNSPRFFLKHMHTITSKSMVYTVHPTKDRFLTYRELLHGMGMPEDFKFTQPINFTKAVMISKNVPVNSARAITNIVKETLNGKFLKTYVSEPIHRINLNEFSKNKYYKFAQIL